MATFKEQTTEQIQKFVAETREKLRATRFSIAGSTSRNVKETKNLRREVARALTELSSRTQ
jgi:ribosomal protein L29